MTNIATLPQRTIGSEKLEVSALGLGCMGMSDFYGPTDDAESLATLARAQELGVTFLDTADMYGIGKNEELVGKFLAGRRDAFVLATKFAIVRGEDGSRAISGRPEYVHSACDASLKRLGIDHIDLYYQHRIDPKTPIEDVIGTLAELIDEGKIRHIGMSEAWVDNIRRAHAVHPITALQSEYSLWTRDPKDEVLPVLAELGIGFVPYSPLGRGFLTGAIRSVDDFPEDDMRRNNPRFQGENFEANLRAVDEVRAIAAEVGVTPGQVALAWVIAQGDHIAPIPGTKHVHRLEENLAADDVVLTADQLARLDAVAPAAGDHHAPEQMAMLDR